MIKIRIRIWDYDYDYHYDYHYRYRYRYRYHYFVSLADNFIVQFSKLLKLPVAAKIHKRALHVY